MNYYKPRFTRSSDEPLPMWEHVYNLVDSKVARLSLQAYERANTLPDGSRRRRHVPYTIPQEAEDMVEMLKELGPDTSAERCEEIAAFATSPGINQAIYGSTL